MIDNTPMADKRQAGTAHVGDRSSTTCGNFFVATLWPSGVHDHAGTRVNTRPFACDREQEQKQRKQEVQCEQPVCLALKREPEKTP
jgi:hypothetical protein